MKQKLRISILIPLLAGVFLAVGLPLRSTAAAGPIHVGAVFPLRESMAPLARQEYLGVQIARDLVNAEGGVDGRKIVLDRKELDAPSQAKPVMDALHRSGVTTVLGAYSSALSIPASAAAAADGMVYWEAGAVADRLTGRGLPTVFRVGASGSVLGTNSVQFAELKVVPRLHKKSNQIRISIVSNLDDYASSVANAAYREAKVFGMHVVSWSRFDAYHPDWSAILAQVRAAHPDILVLASHIQDGVAFRHAFVRAHLHVGAFIGTTMAQCVPDFGHLMGRDAVGVFASDRPPGFFNPNALSGSARRVFDQLAAAWREHTGQPVPSEEGIAGFTAAWALFHYVLPGAARTDPLTAPNIAHAARAINVPTGGLPNGAGLRFATDTSNLGQNLRAAAVVWQWQAVGHSVVVWPPVYATGSVKLVPLPR